MAAGVVDTYNLARLAGTIVVAGLLTASWGPAASGQEGYPPAVEESLAVSEAVVEPGGSLVVAGTGFDRGSVVEVVLRSVEVPLAAVVADSQGRFSVEVAIPCGTSPGPHSIVAKGHDREQMPFEATSAITVPDEPCQPVSAPPGGGESQSPSRASSSSASNQAGSRASSSSASDQAGDQAGGGTLPETGSSATVPLALLAAVLVAAGAVGVLITRRRLSGTE